MLSTLAIYKSFAQKWGFGFKNPKKDATITLKKEDTTVKLIYSTKQASFGKYYYRKLRLCEESGQKY